MSTGPFVIVTGAGRSGTSAVARVLHESGVRMGSSLAPPTEVNPEGFYEDLDVVALNERLLADLGMSDPWRPERWATRAEVLAAAHPYRAEMSTLAKRPVDGWKDPRFAIALEAWLPALLAPPKIVVCLRSTQAYARSVTAIYGLVKPERAVREWSRHYRRLLAVIRAHKLPATCIEYDALIEQPEDVIKALARFVGSPLSARYIVPALRRQQARVPSAYRALYERVAGLGDAPRASYAEVRGHGPRVTARVRGRGSRVETTDYAAVLARVIDRLTTARASWEAVVDMAKLVPMPRSRDACAAYDAQVTEAQRAIAALVPPMRLRRAHDELTRRVNLERMISHLALTAVTIGNNRSRQAALRAWRKFGRLPLAKVSRRSCSRE
jgi:uncharacterized protein with PIN domain